MGKRIPLAEQTAKNVTFSRSGNGQLAKKVKGRVYYFGKVESEARKLWALHKDSLVSGRGWKDTTLSTGTLREAVNSFLAYKLIQVEQHEITQITFNNLVRNWKHHIATIGVNVDVSSLNAKDFSKLRDSWSEWKLVTIRSRTREVIEFVKFCIDEKYIIGKTVGEIIGREFSVPTATAITRENDELPERDILFSASEIKSLLGVCNPQYKLAVLLGINCGFKFSDSESLKLRDVHIDEGSGYIKNRRPKNQQPRIAPLWCETVEAYEAYLGVRPAPVSEKAAAFVLITHSGESVYRPHGSNSAARYYKRKMEALGIFKTGRGISHLRHTFRTVADECLDLKAAHTIMGHSGGIDAVYANPKDIKFSRLVAVTDTVHDWLFGNEKNL